MEQIKNMEPLKHPAFIVALILVGFSTTMGFLFTGEFNTDYSAVYYGTLAATLVTVFAHYLNVTKPIIYILLYHIIASIFLIFVAPIGGPYIFIWMLNIYITHYLYGIRGTIVSLLWLAITVEYALLLQRSVISKDVVVPTIIQIFIIGFTGVFMSNISKRSHKERRLLKETMQKAQIEHQRLLSLVNSMGDAVIATDTDGQILIYNAATLDLLNTNDSLALKPIQKLLNLYDDKNKKVNLISEAKKVRTSTKRTDLKLKFSDNDYMNLYINISPIGVSYDQDQEGGYTFLMRDITKEKSLEEERDEFISVVSHELRTPVTTAEGNVGNALYLSQKSKNKKQVTDALEFAHENIMFLSNLINDLSTLARAERAKVDAEITKIDGKHIVEEMDKSYSISAKSKKLEFESVASDDLPVILSSQLYIEEILQNFITNAIKYTKKGKIILSVGTSGENLKFSVKDTGIGISTSDQKRLFEKFFRSEDYRTRETTGTGLGLYIANKLAVKIKAKIYINSKINGGSEFILEVPSLHVHKKHS